MQMWLAVVLFTVTLAPVAEAECDRPEYHQLDFWIGDWNVVTASGETVGANRIEPILKGCAIQENWTEPSGEEGKSLIHGSAAIRAFWWPAAAAATRVTAMDLAIETIDGCGDVAFVRGRGTLTFTMAATSAPRSQASTFINVLRRQPNGSWLIAERMWSDVR